MAWLKTIKPLFHYQTSSETGSHLFSMESNTGAAWSSNFQVPFAYVETFRTLTVRWELPVFSHKIYTIIYIQCHHKMNCAIVFYNSNIHVWAGHGSSQVTDLDQSQTWLLIHFIVSMLLTCSYSHQHECSGWKFGQNFACDFCFQTNAVSLSDSRWRL